MLYTLLLKWVVLGTKFDSNLDAIFKKVVEVFCFLNNMAKPSGTANVNRLIAAIFYLSYEKVCSTRLTHNAFINVRFCFIWLIF